MKGAIQNQLSAQRKIVSAPLTLKKEARTTSQTSVTIIRTKDMIKSKDNLDSKASTQDRTHKLDASQTKLKDISNIISENLLIEEQNPENNVSGISIINILEGSDTDKPIKKNNTPFDSPQDYGTLKHELEMKNRLIEGLMKENANLRQEIDTALENIDEMKNKENLNPDPRIAQLESENECLRRQLAARHEEEELGKTQKIKQFEDQVKRYCEYAQSSMNEFNARLADQMQGFMDTNRRQYESFSRLMQDQIGELRHSSSTAMETRYSYCTNTSIVGGFNNANEALKQTDSAHKHMIDTPRNNNATGNGSGVKHSQPEKRVLTEGSNTRSMVSLTNISHGDLFMKSSPSTTNLTGKKSGSKDGKKVIDRLPNLTKTDMDEKAELALDKRRATLPSKTLHFENIGKKKELIEVVTPRSTALQSDRRGSLKNATYSSSSTKGKASNGAFPNKKNT